MPDYGVTDNGFVIKRLDTISADIHARLKEEWGVDTTIDPQSLIGVLVTSFADRIAELWEVAADTYFAMYPSSATGVNLDNAMQYGGVIRLKKARTVYNLKCVGKDGTEIPYGTTVKSATQPVKTLQCAKAQTISRNNFRSISVAVIEDKSVYSLTLNSVTYSYTPRENDGSKEILEALSSCLSEALGITSAVEYDNDYEREILTISDTNGNSENALVLSPNLIVTSCTSNLLFETLDYGEVVIPNGTVTEIAMLIDGWQSVTNDKDPVLGRLDATDSEARQSYINRIALRSDNMLSSITSAIFNNVQGVKYITAYENDTDITDEFGRPPHSIEIVVQGGTDSGIADMIISKKPVGISTFGNVENIIIDEYKNSHTVYFSRPSVLYVWIRIELSLIKGCVAPQSFSEITQDTIMNNVDDIAQIGSNCILQKFLSPLYQSLSGVGYVSIKAYASENADDTPTSYELDTITATARQLPEFSYDRIEVTLSDQR